MLSVKMSVRMKMMNIAHFTFSALRIRWLWGGIVAPHNRDPAKDQVKKRSKVLSFEVSFMMV
jgi:hypothetical protein